MVILKRSIRIAWFHTVRASVVGQERLFMTEDLYAQLALKYDFGVSAKETRRFVQLVCLNRRKEKKNKNKTESLLRSAAFDCHCLTTTATTIITDKYCCIDQSL